MENRCNFGYSKQRESDIEKQIKIVKYKKYPNCETVQLFLKWLSINEYLLLSNTDAEIIFIRNGVTYWIHVKQNLTEPSKKLRDKAKMYNSYGIKTGIAYNFYDLLAFVENN